MFCKVKEKIFRLSQQNSIEYKKKKIRVLRELPRQIITERKKYREFTDKLKKMGIRFRWEIPSGLNFTYDNAQQRILSTEQMSKFLNDYSKEFEN